MKAKIYKALNILTFLRLKYFGKSVTIVPKINIFNPQYISIGNYCYFGPDCRVEAWDFYEGESFHPEITFGKNVRINSSCHIGAINRVEIGDDCLLGSHVMIIDHSHGKNEWDEVNIHPSKRKLYSKGSVIIGSRCWIGENVTILPGVHIGTSAVVGANSVVTRNIPDYCVAVGNPAKVVKIIQSLND